MKKKRKFTKKEITAITVLVILMIAVIVAGIIIIAGNSNSADSGTTAAQTTAELSTSAPAESVTESKPEKSSEKKTTSKNNKSSKTKSETVAPVASKPSDTSNNNTKSSTPKKNTSSKPKKSITPSSDNKVPVVVPEKNKEHKSDEICKVNGTDCYVGDTITVTLNLTAPKVAINYQGRTDYDNEYLACTYAKSNTSGLVNGKDDVVLYNASDLNGLDFTSKGTIYTAKFKVKKAGSTTIKNTLEILSDMDLKPINLSSCKIEIEVYN